MSIRNSNRTTGSANRDRIAEDCLTLIEDGSRRRDGNQVATALNALGLVDPDLAAQIRQTITHKAQ